MADYDDIELEDKMSIDWSYCEINEDAWIDQALINYIEDSYETME